MPYNASLNEMSCVTVSMEEAFKKKNQFVLTESKWSIQCY